MTACTGQGPTLLVVCLYFHMPDLFGSLLAGINHNWQQKGKIRRAVSRGIVVAPLLMDEIDSHSCKDYYKIMAKMMTLVDKFVGQAQTSIIPNKTLHEASTL